MRKFIYNEKDRRANVGSKASREREREEKFTFGAQSTANSRTAVIHSKTSYNLHYFTMRKCIKSVHCLQQQRREKKHNRSMKGMAKVGKRLIRDMFSDGARESGKHGIR